MILLLPNVLTDVCQNDNYDRYYVIYYIPYMFVADVIAKDVLALLPCDRCYSHPG